MVCRSRLYIARLQSLTNVRKSTQLPTLAVGYCLANDQRLSLVTFVRCGYEKAPTNVSRCEGLQSACDLSK